MSETARDRIYAAVPQITRNLRQFGYPSLTEDEVRAEVEGLAVGEEPQGIIGMFARDMLVKAGLLPGED